MKCLTLIFFLLFRETVYILRAFVSSEKTKKVIRRATFSKKISIKDKITSILSPKGKPYTIDETVEIKSLKTVDSFFSMAINMELDATSKTVVQEKLQTLVKEKWIGKQQFIAFNCGWLFFSIQNDAKDLKK